MAIEFTAELVGFGLVMISGAGVWIRLEVLVASMQKENAGRDARLTEAEKQITDQRILVASVGTHLEHIATSVAKIEKLLERSAP